MQPQFSNSDSVSAENFLAGGGEMGARMRSLNWAQTGLGPVSTWPAGLRTSVSICLNSRFPILLWWGRDLIMLYNDAYRPILGAKKHPSALGQRGQACWPEIWEIIGPMLEGVLNQGQATWSENLLLILDRNVYPEECYFTFSYSPIRDETQGTVGVFTAVTETTRQVISERRLETLHNLTLNADVLHTVDATCSRLVESLATNPADIPFALLYRQNSTGPQLHLVGSVGLAAGSPFSPLNLDVAQAGEDHDIWPIAQALNSGKPVLVQDLEARFPSLVLKVQSYPVRSALVLPIARPSQESPYGCLIVGLSPIRPLDESYSSFLQLIARQIAAAIANVSALEEERRRAESLAQLDRAKTEFFSNVSHEFRTPLTLLLAPIQDALAQPDENTEIDRASLEMVHRNGLRLLKLVNTLLDFSRIEAGRIEAVYEPTDLAVLTADLASVFRSAVERAGLSLRVECQDLPGPVYVDREMWEKIVLNLLSNALKFTFAGEIEVLLQPSVFAEDAATPWMAELSVRDTGVGIHEDDLNHVFERFYRGHQSRARTQEGTGIGLALVKELVRLHGGAVQVTSRPGEGSIFTISIPGGKAHLPTDRIEVSRTQASTALGAAPFVEEALRWLPDSWSPPPYLTGDIRGLEGPLPAQRARILVVDDNADMRDYLRHLLSPRWQIETAGDGAAALEAARERLPDLVLSDVMLPGLDGFELLKELRQDPKTWEIPFILLSARAGEEARLQGLEAGADDYLVKPFSARELLARIEARLEMKALRAASERRITGILRELERSNRELEGFAFIASHDLQEPLRKIQAFGGVLENQLKPKLTSEELGYFYRMRNAAARMSRMVQDLLDYSRVSVYNRSAVSVDLNEIVSAVVDNLEIRIEHTQGQVTAGELPALLVDPLHMRQLFQNLVGNALKFHQPGLPPVVNIYRQDGTSESGAKEFVEICFADNGIGFEPEHIERMFQPFHRLHGHSDYEGSGIGLAICRKIVECYDGRITARGQPDGGATFTVSFPIQLLVEK